MSHAENVIRRVLHITMIFTAVLAVLAILSCAAFADTNSAPEWMSGALKEDSQTVTLGNPYTPKQSITAKWTDPDGDKLVYWYSVDDGTPALCTDYNGSEGQLPYFAYTFTSLGTHTLKIWVSDNKTQSDPYVATVTVVDPETYEYNMTIMAAPKDADLEFFKCEGFNENGEDIPGEEIEPYSQSREENYNCYHIKMKTGTYSFRGEDSEGNKLGGMTFQVPNEARVAGSSETIVCIREIDIGCATKYDETNYCTEEYFRPHITTWGHEAVYGSVYTSEEMSFFRTMAIAAGNDMTYQYYLEAKEKARLLGFADGGFSTNLTVTAAGSIMVMKPSLSKSKEVSFKVPSGADVRVFFQRNNYGTLDRTSQTFKDKSVNGDGTETWSFSIPTQSGKYSWRVSKDGRLTRAGFMSAVKNEIDLTEEDDCDPDSTLTTAGSGYIDNSILLSVNSSNTLELEVGEEFTVNAYRAWQIITDPGSNIMIEPDFHTEIINGSDVIEIHEGETGNAFGNKFKLVTKKEGFAVLRVFYDAIKIYGGSDTGIYGACDKVREGILIVRVGKKSSHNVSFRITGKASRNTEWDAEFDTCYFTGESGELYMAPISDDGINTVSIADSENFSFTDLEEEEGRYTIPVKAGNNVIRVITDNGEEHYQIVRGCLYSYTLTNVTRKGKAPVVGDTVKLHLNGLYMPVPKMSGVYNPGYMSTGKVNYITEAGTEVESPGSQYDFITTQDITVTILRYSSGEYELTNGQMSISIMAAPNCLGLHRSIPYGGLNTMFNAVSNGWKGSALGDLGIPVSKTGHGLQFSNVVEDSEFRLVNAEGTDLIPDETYGGNIVYPELPDGTYSYTVTRDGYGAVSGEAVLTAKDSGQKEINIEQKLNDQTVQNVIDEIKALPESDQLTKNDIAAVDNAKAEYDSLSDEQKSYISKDITDKLNALVHEAAILRDDDVTNVISLIKALPDTSELTLDDKDKVDASDKAFKALSDIQKALVDEKLQKRLTAAVRQMSTLVTDKENQDAADLAEQYIKALPAVDALTLGDKDAVDQAKSYYDSLTRTQKALVPDSSKLALTDAVNKIKELEEQARQAEEEARQAEEAARRAEEKYRQDKAAAEAAEQLITDLPVLSAMTLNDKEKVESAKAKYDSLTDDQKALVSDSNKQLLQSALDKIDKLEEQARQAEEEARRAAEEQAERERQKAEQEKKNKAAAEATEQLITGLPALNDMTLNDKEKVESAKAKYDNLTDDQKALVSDSNKQLLHNALDKIDELEELARQAEEEAKRAAEEQEERERQKAEQEKKNKAAAEATEQMITQLPAVDSITLEDKEKIEAAKAKYDSLTDDQKALVADSNKQKLQNAIDKIGELEEQARKAAEEQAEREREQAEQVEKDKAAAEAVLQKIVELPALQELTLNDKTKVEQIRVSFDGLTELQKALVPYDMQVILQSAESRIKELEQINIAKAYKTKIKAKALKGHKAKITWKKLSKVTGYKVYRATKKKGKYKLIKTLSSPKKVTFTNSKLKKDNYYYYKVLPYTRINGAVYKGKWSNISRIKAK